MKKGFTLIELMIVIAIIAIIAAIAIPGLLAAQRASNERNASASLKTITTSEADFRTNDRDGNLVNDYWTLDVWALYALIPIPGGSTAIPGDVTTTANIIKLVEPSVGGADGQSAPTADYGSVFVADSIVVGSTKAGYFYRAFGNQEEGGVSTTLLNDTDGAGLFYANAHDRTRFAFAAFPETLSSGKLMFIVNGDNQIWKFNLPGDYVAVFTAMQAGASSTSTTAFTFAGPTADFTFTGAVGGAAIFPQSPGANGCSKMD